MDEVELNLTFYVRADDEQFKNLMNHLAPVQLDQVSMAFARAEIEVDSTSYGFKLPKPIDSIETGQ